MNRSETKPTVVDARGKFSDRRDATDRINQRKRLIRQGLALLAITSAAVVWTFKADEGNPPPPAGQSALDYDVSCSAETHPIVLNDGDGNLAIASSVEVTSYPDGMDPYEARVLVSDHVAEELLAQQGDGSNLNVYVPLESTDGNFAADFDPDTPKAVHQAPVSCDVVLGE